MIYFYDTNILLQGDKKLLDETFLISNITIQELEDIKTSIHKDENIKYQARKALRWLQENQGKYYIIIYQKLYDTLLPFEVDNNDKKILSSVKQAQKLKDFKDEEIIFVTLDIACSFFAKIASIKYILYRSDNKNQYNGYIEVYCNTDDELADFYTKINAGDFESDNLYINEYLLLYHNNEIIDKYRYIGDNVFDNVTFLSANSKMFGKVKPIDAKQQLVLDSLKHNKLTLIKGPAGTGKSLLSLAYLFKLLEDNKIDKIIIFCNTVATAGSAKLGYYPGDRTEKLLDSSIGNFLISKLGAREAVERLIEEEQLLLLPMSDIRGFDTTGMKAGIYITEAQNLTIDLMKLALQRIGEDSICILDGDNEAQVDLGLYAGSNNGLKRVSEVFRGQPFYGQITLTNIHRSQIANIANNM